MVRPTVDVINSYVYIPGDPTLAFYWAHGRAFTLSVCGGLHYPWRESEAKARGFIGVGVGVGVFMHL